MRRLATALLLAFFCALPGGYATAATTVISPDPLLHFVDNNGNPLIGGKLFTYAAGTTTKQATYTDYSGGTPNTDPIILNARGEANVWLDPTLSYKFVLAPATDSDPPTNPIWTVDNIIGLTATPMPIPIAQGGTGATTAAGALANLGVTSIDVNCATQSGADAGAMISACMAIACPGSNNGVADASGIVGAQSSATSVVIPAGCTLKLGAITLTMATGQNISLSNNSNLLGIGMNNTAIVGNIAGLGVVEADSSNNRIQDLGVTQNDTSSAFDYTTVTGGSAALRSSLSSFIYTENLELNGGKQTLMIYHSYYDDFNQTFLGTGSVSGVDTSLYLNQANSNVFHGLQIISGGQYCVDNEWSESVSISSINCESVVGGVFKMDAETYPSGAGLAQLFIYGGYIQTDNSGPPLSIMDEGLGGGSNPPVLNIYSVQLFVVGDCTGPAARNTVLFGETANSGSKPTCTQIVQDGLGGFTFSGPSAGLTLNTTASGNSPYQIFSDINAGNGVFIRNPNTNTGALLNFQQLDLYGNTVTTITGTSGTATCLQSMVGDLKVASCTLNGYAQTGTAQTYNYPTGFSQTPALSVTDGWGHAPSTTNSILTLPAAGGMTAQSGNIVATGN